MKIFLFALAVVLVTTFSWADILFQQTVSYHQQAEAALRHGDIDQAITFYQKIILIDNNDAVAHSILGVLYEGRNQLGRAENEYLNTLRLNQEHLDTHANLARLYEKTGQNKKAAEHLEKFITLAKPKDERVAAAKTKIIELVPPPQRKSSLVRNIEQEQAQELAKQISQDKRLLKKENKKKSKSHFSLGKKYYRQKKYALALQEFETALGYDQSNKKAARHMSICQQKIIKKSNLKSQGDEKKKK